MVKIDDTLTNFDRLASHLKKGALSARLVAAYVAAPAIGKDSALEAVIKARITEIASTYDASPDKAD